MSEMIERVAKAINEEMRKMAPNIPSWDEFSEEERQAIYPVARVAIEAMRESTFNMDHAGTKEWPEDNARCWSAMIDEALK